MSIYRGKYSENTEILHFEKMEKEGMGKQAVKYIEKYYHSRNVKKIEMDANYEAVGFYEACGYEKVSDIFIEADKKHITMRKNI